MQHNQIAVNNKDKIFTAARTKEKINRLHIGGQNKNSINFSIRNNGNQKKMKWHFWRAERKKVINLESIPSKTTLQN